MRLLKSIQRLTLSTVLILALSACSSKESNDTNSTEPTAGTTQGGGTVSGTGVGSTETTGAGGMQASGNTGGGGSAASQTDTPSNASGTSDTNTNQTTQNDNTHTDNNTTSDNDSNTETNATTDVTPPVITLNGESTVTVFQDTPYTELSAIATDVRDANVSVSVSGSVDVSTLGSYIITYTAVDSAGNSTTVQRTVNVVLSPDTQAPVITLNGDGNITLTLGESYEELGATATDNRDGDVNVTISGSVDTSTEGTYTMTYTATDKVGNVVTANRTVTVVAPALASLSLECNVTTLNVGETAELTVTGTYSDGSSKEVDANIEYIISPLESVDVNGTIIIAKKDGTVTVQVKVNGVLSNEITLNITWIVNGHVLPPEPDKILNDSTLLGVDVNDNGVRDDVERWIYETYEEPIERGIFMQSARAYQKVIVEPSKAKDTMRYIDNSSDCEGYWRYWKILYKDKNETFVLERYRDLEKEIRGIQFNTIKRHMAYTRFNGELSGGVYGSTGISKDKCEFNENGILKVLK